MQLLELLYHMDGTEFFTALPRNRVVLQQWIGGVIAPLPLGGLPF